MKIKRPPSTTEMRRNTPRRTGPHSSRMFCVYVPAVPPSCPTKTYLEQSRAFWSDPTAEAGSSSLECSACRLLPHDFTVVERWYTSTRRNTSAMAITGVSIYYPPQRTAVKDNGLNEVGGAEVGGRRSPISGACAICVRTGRSTTPGWFFFKSTIFLKQSAKKEKYAKARF